MAADADSKQLEMLLTYTTFHLGLYTSLGAAIAGIKAIKNLGHPTLRFAVFCLLIAGVSGGVIGSNIPNYSTFKDFDGDLLGFWMFRLYPYRTWAMIEHTAFWLAVIVPTLTWVFHRQSRQSPPEPLGDHSTGGV